MTVAQAPETRPSSNHTAETTTYTVREAAARVGLSEHTLRYYERIGLIAPVERDGSSRHRRYSSNDLLFIEFLKRMRATGMPIEQMQRYAALTRQGDGTLAARLAMLEAHRAHVCAHIAALQSHLAVIDYKIDRYMQMGAEQNWPDDKCLQLPLPNKAAQDEH